MGTKLEGEGTHGEVWTQSKDTNWAQHMDKIGEVWTQSRLIMDISFMVQCGHKTEKEKHLEVQNRDQYITLYQATNYAQIG